VRCINDGVSFKYNIYVYELDITLFSDQIIFITVAMTTKNKKQLKYNKINFIIIIINKIYSSLWR
jgi:hypothetical protein